MRLFLVLFCLMANIVVFSQGKFAGSYRSLLNKNYQNENQLTILQGFTCRGGTLLSDPSDPIALSGSWYIKGNLIVAIFEQTNEDKSRTILDVLEVRNVQPNQLLSIGDCKDGDNQNAGFVVLVTQTKEERFKAVKAWYFNRDKIRLAAWDATNVTCIGMVGDD
ncbi:MAG: hypothetical protein ACKOE6_13540 [Flammeovirgaceae bacterium]